MKAIGIRELRQNASGYLRQVESGQTLEVTAHGRLIAFLVPARPAGRRQLLLGRGRLVAGSGDLLDLGVPLRPSRGVPPSSATLERTRSNER